MSAFLILTIYLKDTLTIRRIPYQQQTANSCQCSSKSSAVVDQPFVLEIARAVLYRIWSNHVTYNDVNDST